MQELRAVLALAIPLIFTQLGQMLLGVVDAAFVGHVSLRALDAVTLGNLWQVATMIPLYGVVIGLDPLVSQAHGAGRRDDAGLALQRALLLVALLSLPLCAAWLYAEEGLVLLGQDPSLAHQAELYVRAQLFAAPAILGHGALSVYLNARGVVRPGLVTIALGNLANVLLDWMLIFGKLGAPAYGLSGAGLATGISRVFLVLVLGGLTFALGLHRDAWVPWSTRVLERNALARQLGLGLPVGVTLALEVWAFQLGTLIAGRLDPVSLGAHSVVMGMASFMFMVPLGIGVGASTRVGNLVGAGRLDQAERAARASLKLACLFAALSMAVFGLGRHAIPTLFTEDAAIVAAAATVMPVAGAFQMMDALQAVAGGVLRGMGRPRVTAAFNLVGYFVLGTPLAYLLALRFEVGLVGIWLGYLTALTFVAGGLVLWVLRRGPRTAQPLGH